MRRGLLLSLLLALPLAADVVILKDGTRYTGRVVDKGDSYEITTRHGTLTVQKSEVDKVASDPKQVVQEADALREEARKLYEEGCANSDAFERNGALDAAIKLLEKARGIYTDTRLDFPGGEYAWMDDEILAIGQAIKLARDRHVMAGDSSGGSPAKEYRIRRDALKPGDAEGHFVLGTWCEGKGLAAEAKTEFEAVLRIAPDHAGAREKLGYVFHEGKWMTREERDRLGLKKPADTPPPPSPPPDAGEGGLFDAWDAGGQKDGIAMAARVCLTTIRPEVEKKARGVLMRHKRLALTPVSRALGSTLPETRVRAVRILEEMRTRGSVRALVAMGCYAGESDGDTLTVMRTCREALERIGRPAVPYLIEVLPNDELARLAMGVLESIAREPRLTEDAAAYRKWWAAHRTPDDELKDE